MLEVVVQRPLPGRIIHTKLHIMQTVKKARLAVLQTVVKNCASFGQDGQPLNAIMLMSMHRFAVLVEVARPRVIFEIDRCIDSFLRLFLQLHLIDCFYEVVINIRISRFDLRLIGLAHFD